MRSLFILLLTLSTFFVNATIHTAIANIDQGANKGWQNPNNWIPVGVPQNGDVAFIPAGMTISVKGNVYTTPIMLSIQISGTLDFDPSGTLNLSPGSIVQLYSNVSKITSNGTSSEQIIIAGDIKYNARNDGTITGPAFTSQASPTSSSSAPGAGFTNGVLPIKLSSFTASESKGSIKINWTTLSENNVKVFEIQRSIDARNWTTAGMVFPKSNCQCATNYEWVDKKPENGVNMYRLLTKDIDGSTTYSPTIVVKNVATGKAVSLSVNGSSLNLSLENAIFSLPAQLKIFNVNGQLMENKMIEQFSVVDLSSFSTGTFIVSVTDKKGNLFSTRIIK